MIMCRNRGNICEQGWRKGPWIRDEDKLLTEYVRQNGDGRWSSVSKLTGLNRSGKSCRLRWVNYLRPGLKKGHITPQEEGIIAELHALWGNKWSTIARYLPGRTDNEIKNYWRTHFKKGKKPRQIEREIFRQKHQEEEEEINKKKNIKALPEATVELATINEEEEGGKHEAAEIQEYYSCPVICSEDTWSDLIPLENYLWGTEIWNLDHQN